ncbi:uncharacterized protein LOC115455249 [Manduca sexta]|uniref:Uncharacterized protein n=1 Tax=Manduca sexta TaxID=7130 RepID=A0A921YPK3_MANSE|nr:uncharacterized protein LOC115455249 [Manduca sexta]KAG6442840.1 hypothetical protein O3G_MSEX002535 [Manduca sexta]
MYDDNEWHSDESGKTYFKASLVLVMIVCSGVSFVIVNTNSPMLDNTTKEQCISELALLKRQIEVVTSYQKRMDKVLTDTLATHDADKDRFKVMIQSCFAMPQQFYFCQKRYNAMQASCNMIRGNYARVVKELNVLKNTTRPG